MSFKACIFDLDGTLCDSVESIAVSANRALREIGRKEASLEQYKKFVGDGVDELMYRLLRFGGDEKAEHFEELKRLYTEYFKEGCLYNIKPYPGILKLLGELKEQGAKLAVLSNKPHENTKNVVEKCFGTELFDLVQGQSDAFKRKPDPSGALYLAGLLETRPEQVMYLGDTGTDMKTGRAAGMYTVGVLWGFRTEAELWENGAEEVVSEAEQILARYKKGDERKDKGEKRYD